MSRHKTLINFNELSSASCDLVNVINRGRFYMKPDHKVHLDFVNKFINSLYPANYARLYPDNEGREELEINSEELHKCVIQIEYFLKSLPASFLDKPKDDEGSETSIRDCLNDVLNFLKSL